MLLNVHARLLAALPNGGTGTAPPGGIAARLDTLFGWIVYLALAACIIGLIFAFVKMAIARRHQEEINGGQIALAIVSAIGIVGATGLINGVIA